MNKFQKLSQLNKDIELLENAGKIKAAEVLHKKFIREAQYAMPAATVAPYASYAYQGAMPVPVPVQMSASRYVYPQVPVAPALVAKPIANSVVTPAPMPVAQPRTTPVQTIGTPNPGVSPAPIPAPKPVASPGNMQLAQPAPPNPYDNYYQDPKTGKTIFVDPITGRDIPGQGGGVSNTPPGNYQQGPGGQGGLVTVPPPGSTPPPDQQYKDPMEDPRVKQFWNKIGGNDFLSGKQKEQMLDQYMRSIGLK
jgi:hypothetical protein